MDDFFGQDQPRHSKWWIWILVILLLVVVGYGGYWYWKNKIKKSDSGGNNSEQIETEEIWTRGDHIVLEGVTSSDTHKLADGIYRMYYMNDAKIIFADSTDGLLFGTGTPTGITEDTGKMISNPSVLNLSDGNWIMIYEQQPMRKTNSGQTPPGPDSQRDLYLATSLDGKSFTKVGIAIDSSKEDNYFASVPDLVLLPDGKIRMYYVSGGEAIGSAISSDNGKTWKRETGYRLADKAVDPDVILKDENGTKKWVMYFSTLTGGGNSLYKATSEDGLTWVKGQEILKSLSSQTNIVDPDVVNLYGNNYRMYFGEAKENGANGQPSQFNLNYADTGKEILAE